MAKYPVTVLPPSHRAKFLRICDKLKVSRQAITDPSGFYHNLIAAGYNYAKMKDKLVHFNGTKATTPLSKKRDMFLERHLNMDNTSAHTKDGQISRHHLSLIAWAYTLSPMREVLSKLDELYLKLFGDG